MNKDKESLNGSYAEANNVDEFDDDNENYNDMDDYDEDQIIAEIEQEQQMKEMLDRSIADLKLTILDLDKKFELLDQEESDWKARYETQKELNEQLRRSIQSLKEKLRQSKANNQKKNISLSNFNEMSEGSLKALIRNMEKEKKSMEGQLRDLEWRLDQESKAYYKASDTKRKYQTEMNQASMMLNTYERVHRMKIKSKSPGKPKSKASNSIKLPPITQKHSLMKRNRRDQNTGNHIEAL